jgi:hypothetical protein
MAVIRDDLSAPRIESDAEPVLETEEARQADGHRQNLRILDISLPLAILALALVAIYVAAVAAT